MVRRRLKHRAPTLQFFIGADPGFWRSSVTRKIFVIISDNASKPGDQVSNQLARYNIWHPGKRIQLDITRTPLLGSISPTRRSGVIAAKAVVLLKIMSRTIASCRNHRNFSSGCQDVNSGFIRYPFSEFLTNFSRTIIAFIAVNPNSTSLPSVGESRGGKHHR